MDDGMLLVISGPSGSGKGTVVKGLMSADNCALSVSVTTRAPRSGEEHGRDYFFITESEYSEMVLKNELLEYASFCGNHYGTPRKYVEGQIELGKNVILEIEVNGALQVKEKFPDCVLIFLLPPNIHELKRRLLGRETEDECEIEKRLQCAAEEIEFVNRYDYIIINDNVERALSDIEAVITTEKLRPARSVKKIKAFKGE